MDGFQIPIEIEIDFLEYIVISFFGVTLDWMIHIAGNVYGDTYKLETFNSCNQFHSIIRRSKSRMKLTKRVRVERAAEAFLLRQQLAGTFILFSFHEC